MNNLVELNTGIRFSFKAEAVYVRWTKSKNNNNPSEMKQVYVISLVDKETGCDVIHPLTNFILEWKNSKSNTMRKHAITTADFLNFLLQDCRELSSLSELEIIHGNKFLNNKVSSGLIRETIYDYERTLTQFYRYLSDNNILSKIHPTSFVKAKGLYGEYIKSPFDIGYPPKKPKDTEHLIPFEYIPLFLDIASQVAHPILLGIYFQIFGGLRTSEVINITRSSLKVTPTGAMTIKLLSRNLRPDLKSPSGAVKRTRTQNIINIFDWLKSIYFDHVKLYSAIDGSNALFVNRDGSAMSQNSYRQYFTLVKQSFINYLISEKDIDSKLLGNYLKTAKWSTHIGRGTFTNLIAEESDNIADIAFARGDKDFKTSLIYMSDTERMTKKIEKKFSNMHSKYLPDLNSKLNGGN